MSNKERLADQKRRESKRARRQQKTIAVLPRARATVGLPTSGSASVESIAELGRMGWYAPRAIVDGCPECEQTIEFVEGSIRATTLEERSNAPTVMSLPAAVAFERRCTHCGAGVSAYLAKDPMTYSGADRFQDADYRDIVVELFGEEALRPTS